MLEFAVKGYFKVTDISENNVEFKVYLNNEVTFSNFSENSSKIMLSFS